MPNKRDPNKAMVGVYIDREAKEMVMEILREKGSNLSEFFYAKILELLETKADAILEKIHENDGRTKAGKLKRQRKKSE
jgi:hypothetical protein